MEHRPKILSTAPLPAALAEKIHSAGLDLHVYEAIAIEFPEDAALQQQVNETTHNSGNIIFTSSNAVTAVARMPGGKHPNGWNIFCLEGKTSETVRTYWPHLTITATAPDSRALAQLIISAAPQSCTFFCGGSRMDTLPALLASAGISVKEIIVYHTLKRPSKLDFQPDAALFFSPSAIESMQQDNDLSAIPELICIGQSTAAAFGAALQQQVHIAASASKESVVETLIQLYKKHP
ncbi:MAG: uroporphyrinogen-III synthase [Chitinophagaceae bacterium]